MLRKTAPAKFDLAIHIEPGKKADGYYPVYYIDCQLDLGDKLTFENQTDVIEVICDEPTLDNNKENFVYKSAILLREIVDNLHLGARITLFKNIPIKAGFGGGSSDAAAAIIALNALLGLGWSRETMAGVGSPLGSDVPFFLFAPSALVRGRGEDVTAFAVTGTRWVVLVNPGFPIETRWAYEQLSAGRSGVRPLADGLRGIDRGGAVSWEQAVALMENDFEAALAPSHPVLGQIKQQLLDAGAEAALLSGSGATVFGVFRDKAAAVRAQQALGRTEGWRVFAVPAGTAPLLCEAGGAPNPTPVG